MPRTLQFTLPDHQTDTVINDIQHLNGLIGLRLQRGISVQPPGDVVTVEITNRGLHPLMQRLTEHGIGQNAGTSITTNEPVGIVSSSSAKAITCDTSDATWEEMEMVMGKESNMTANTLILMCICGIVATIGISTNALHLVIAAMVLAPGFEPIVRVGLGIVAQSTAWRRGLSDFIKGYVALIVAAAVTTVVLKTMGSKPLGEEASYLPAGVLISYWTTITFSSLLVSAVASIAGALLVATYRSVLTLGVMVALALIPAATIMSMGLVAGDWAITIRALIRWLIECSFVIVAALVVFSWKKQSLHRRKMLL